MSEMLLIMGTKISGPSRNIIFSVVCVSVFILLASPCLAGGHHPDDDLDTDIEWVSSGSTTIIWGKVVEIEVEGTSYLLKALDFSEDDESAAISVARKSGGAVESSILLIGEVDDSCIEYEYELKVELTGVSRNSAGTPSAKVSYYEPGEPELDIDMDASSETVDEIKISADQYAPGEEKTIDIDVKNTGEAWVENIELVLNIGDLEIKEKNGLEGYGSVFTQNLGYLDKGESTSVNFSVVAPEWDGVTSPYDINYEINASVEGADIKGHIYNASTSHSLFCTDPQLRVVRNLYSDELYMSPWYDPVKSNVYDDKYSVLRLGIYNIGLYTVKNVSITDPSIPGSLYVRETFEDGSLDRISEETPYTIEYQLLPVRQGTYKLDGLTVSANFYGRDFSWKADSFTIDVHGPHIVLKKTLEDEGNGKYRLKLEAYNDGDRGASGSLTDSVPVSVNYIDGSFQSSIEGSEEPLSEWDFGVFENKSSVNLYLKGVFLPPDEHLTVSYLVSPNSKEALTLPHAELTLRDANGYEETVISSSFEQGREVKQIWDPATGKWNPETPKPVYSAPEVVKAPEKEPEQKQETEQDTAKEEVLPVNTSLENEDEYDGIQGQVKQIFDLLQGKMHTLIELVLQTIGSVFNVAGKTALTIVEEHFYILVGVVALASFMVIYTLVLR